jgi:hypothetical protein
MVEVHCGEGLAIHTGPESCDLAREGVVEALTRVCAGQPLSGESKLLRDTQEWRLRTLEPAASSVDEPDAGAAQAA